MATVMNLTPASVMNLTPASIKNKLAPASDMNRARAEDVNINKDGEIIEVPAEETEGQITLEVLPKHHHPKMFGAIGGVNVTVPIQELDDALRRIAKEFHGQNTDPGSATQLIVSHLRTDFPEHNVMVVHPQHMESFEDKTHSRFELHTLWVLRIPYDVYVFKRGHFTLLGDGGFRNWCFSGRWERSGHRVRFFDI